MCSMPVENTIDDRTKMNRAKQSFLKNKRKSEKNGETRSSKYVIEKPEALSEKKNRMLEGQEHSFWTEIKSNTLCDVSTYSQSELKEAHRSLSWNSISISNLIPLLDFSCTNKLPSIQPFPQVTLESLPCYHSISSRGQQLNQTRVWGVRVRGGGGLRSQFESKTIKSR